MVERLGRKDIRKNLVLPFINSATRYFLNDPPWVLMVREIRGKIIGLRANWMVLAKSCVCRLEIREEVMVREIIDGEKNFGFLPYFLWLIWERKFVSMLCFSGFFFVFSFFSTFSCQAVYSIGFRKPQLIYNLVTQGDHILLQLKFKYLIIILRKFWRVAINCRIV